MAEMEKVTEETLIACWNTLSVAPDFFKTCEKLPINYVWAKEYPRRLYCLQCESIEFQDENGEKIWSTTGDGEMTNLPARVGVYIVRGKAIIQ
ncbi:hypothetical protein BO82DRAFT_437442 [Aspergillus uvarum CBS 121591]|uniref:Uncharacterized protein n=1 Tax=Aspergillus uvarum CBS 121591 TaxID=1448315 RepID=A0A319BPJ2_9EURO|nr:hypothetical protein BO82DRAFT_437442 [Aspergillus uvarum CBS 121591]PYH75336.1 hypothetical protein BO82DRAFT_437442 [Aspergillus uvarum CBS 121591]